MPCRLNPTRTARPIVARRFFDTTEPARKSVLGFLVFALLCRFGFAATPVSNCPPATFGPTPAGLGLAAMIQAPATVFFAPTITTQPKAISDRLAPPRQRPAKLSAGSTLREFFELWFLPVVLNGDTNAKLSTVRSYESSLDWWERLTDDPPLSAVDAYTLATLKTGLRAATWRRGPHAPARTLSAHSIAKHLKQLRAVLLRVGPTIDRALPSAGLLDNAPFMRVATPKRQMPKPAMPLDVVRAVVLECLRLRDADDRREWFARVSLLFYTGARIGTAQAVGPRNVVEREGRRWLIVDGEDVKTGNAFAVPLHAEAAAALDRLPARNGRFFRQVHPRTLSRKFAWLQKRAGVARPLGFHAVRRTHGEQMVAVGAASGQLAAQLSLDHARADTTRQFYADARALLIDRLPKLVDDVADLGQLRLFS